MNDRIPYVSNNPERRLVEDAEGVLFVLGIFYVIRRAFKHNHTRALAVMAVSAASALIVMMQLDMTSLWAWLFWALVAVAFVSLAKILS